jgi:hypothetical protein
MNKIKIINHKFIYGDKYCDKTISKVYSNTKKVIGEQTVYILGGFGSFFIAIAQYYISRPLQIPVIDNRLNEIFIKEEI